MTTGTHLGPPAPAGTERAPAAASGPVQPPWPGIALIAVAAVAVEIAVSARYGYVRDELYFLSAGHHLAFGYATHGCAGQGLSRIEAQALIGSLLRRVESIELAGEPVRHSHPMIRGMEALPVSVVPEREA